MNKNILKELVKELSCEYDIGIWSEINSFLEYQEDDISHVKLNFNNIEKCYVLEIILKKSDSFEIHDFFKKFTQFIEYRKSSFYVREEKNNSIEYYLLSCMNNEKGFFMHILFNNEPRY